MRLLRPLRGLAMTPGLRCLAMTAATLLVACGSHVIPPAVPPIPEGERLLSIFLIGDAGRPAADDPVLAELRRQASAAPRGSAIVFLGDNLYPRGLPATGDPVRPEMERRLTVQIGVGRASGLMTYFVPGNHDWDRMGPDGWNAVRRSEAFIRSVGGGLARQIPGGGCPGPEAVEIGPVRLLALDTEWWLRKPPLPKPADPSSGCPAHSESEVAAALREMLAAAVGKRVIVAAHHPLATAGEHGGHFSIWTHLFPLRSSRKCLWLPLPLLGSIYPIARANGITAQDLSGGANERMRAALEEAMAASPPLLYAAGHDHGLQVFRGPTAKYSVVSGAGIADHQSAVGWNDNTVYASSSPGFIRLDLAAGGRIRLAVVTVRKTGADEALAIWLTEP
ncbi:MAG: hypothetical protein HOP28_07125 [Gemmatimonadales bacterium]|nr:hypothetical protein [Gemmatimonadales bacterium]